LKAGFEAGWLMAQPVGESCPTNHDLERDLLELRRAAGPKVDEAVASV